MDIRLTQALRGYGSTRTDLKPEPKGNEATFLGDVAKDFADTLRQTEVTAENAMIGTADPHALVEALANTQLA
ncbi:MAG: flagellar hook-basal body protein FliE, partial [Pseudomonadota bacterium]